MISSEFISSVTNHLWQSTLFAAVAGLLTLVLRKNRASARHWIWLAASVKFLVPFSLLVTLGSYVEAPAWSAAPTVAVAPTAFADTVRDILAPQALAIAAPDTSPEHPSRIPAALLVAWACGFLAVIVMWARQWWRVHASLRSSTPVRLSNGITARSIPNLYEPGVFGIIKPVLLLPEGIADRLMPAEFEAILAHEMCHIRRRDNLFSFVHMLVEAMFWFHPLVWWLGRQLTIERERACDEEVLRVCLEPQVYAEGILKVCEFYLESPPMVAGVTGSNLKKRIEEIMTDQVLRRLTFGKKLLITIAGVAAVAAPIVIGMMNSTPALAQSQGKQQHLAFEVASVKPSQSSEGRMGGLRFLPGGRLSAKDVPLLFVVSAAFDIPFQGSGGRLTAPEWLHTERFDIEATAEKSAIAGDLTVKARQDKMRLMLQTLLEERFKMVVRRETKEVPVYAAIVGKGGAKLEKSKLSEKDCPEDDPTLLASCHVFNGGMGRGLHGIAADMSDLVTFVSNWSDRPVVDHTGIKGLFNIQTDGWAPMQPSPNGTGTKGEDGVPWSERQTLFTIFEKLGLKLEATKAPVETYTIVSIERPAGN
jgi:bla regulator protein BlaR1